ncbi:MAG: tetratricopeptide repeat protein [bacterium]|nr:tetratricopeptide repeat protein [bacterium]
MRVRLTKFVLIFSLLVVQLLAMQLMAQEEKTKEHFLNEAIEHEKKGETDAAILAYKGAIQKDGKFVDALNNLGAIYFKQKDWENALDMFKKAAEADPGHSDSQANLGRIQLKLTHYAEAEAAFNAAIASDPGNSEVLKDLGTVYYKKQDWGPLAETMAKYHASNEGTYQSWFMLGKGYHKTGRTAEAISAYDKSVALKNNYSAQFALGQIYLSQNKYNTAATKFNAAYKANSKGFRAMYNYAIAVESGDPENFEANIAAWSKFVTAASKNSLAHKELAEAKAHIKELKEAKEQADMQ